MPVNQAMRIGELEALLQSAQDTISALVEEIKQLGKEADWLALKVAANDKCLFVCPLGKEQTLEQCQKCFRDQAREAVIRDGHNTGGPHERT